MKNVKRAVTNQHQKNFIDVFNRLCYSRTRWNVWADFIVMAAIEVSSAVDQVHAPQRLETYKTMSSRYNPDEKEMFGQLLTEIVNGMEENPDQDFLGELYMVLELGNDHAGQFFTPYSVCKMMAKMQSADIKTHIQNQGWFSVSDCACGAGALLVAFANECREQGVNFQTSVLFVAQDIDYTVACMCYLQLSLLGCAGYVVIGDSIANPSTSYDKRGLVPKDDGNVWYTPFYFREEWHWRKVAAYMSLMCSSKPKEENQEEKVEEPEIEFPEEKNGQLRLF